MSSSQYLGFYFSSQVFFKILEIIRDLIPLIIVFKMAKFGFLCTFSCGVDSQLCIPFIFAFLRLFPKSSVFLEGIAKYIIPLPRFPFVLLCDPTSINKQCPAVWFRTKHCQDSINFWRIGLFRQQNFQTVSELQGLT